MAVDTTEIATSSAPSNPPAESPAEPAAAPAPQIEAPAPGEGTQPPAAPAFDPAALSPEQKAAVLRSLDPDEAIRLDQRLSGKLGALAQQQAQREAERLLPQLLDRELPRILEHLNSQTAAQQEAERRRAAIQKGDTFEALELLKTQEERNQRLSQQQQQEQLRAGQLSKQQLDKAWENARDEFLAQPEDVRQKIGYGKQYGVDPVAALAAFNRDIANARAEYLAEQKANQELRPKLEEQIRRDLEPALRKQILAELNSREPSPDTGGGAPPVGDMVTQEEWDRNKHDSAWVRQNLGRAKAAMFAGRLRG